MTFIYFGTCYFLSDGTFLRRTYKDWIHKDKWTTKENIRDLKPKDGKECNKLFLISCIISD